MPTYPYDASFKPAAPMLPVEISRPFGPAIETVRGMVDSGSDITTIPSTLVKSLGLMQVGPIEVSEVLNPVKRMRNAYSARVAFQGSQGGTIKVILWDGDCILLGRDVLNRYKVTLDGPRSSLEIE